MKSLDGRKKSCYKTPLSNGSRGVRIIDESINLKEKFLTKNQVH